MISEIGAELTCQSWDTLATLHKTEACGTRQVKRRQTPTDAECKVYDDDDNNHDC